MTAAFTRRTMLGASAFGLAAGRSLTSVVEALAAETDSVTIGWPQDVPGFDPNQRFVPDAQPIFKMIFDQPLDQDPKLKLIPNVIKSWELAPDGKSLAIEMRDDVVFSNGDKMTTADFRYTFFERIKAGHKVDIANSWRKVTDIEISSPPRR